MKLYFFWRHVGTSYDLTSFQNIKLYNIKNVDNCMYNYTYYNINAR